MSIESGGPGKERLAVEIGPARPEDAREIAELLYRSWRATYPNEQFGVTERAIRDYWAPEFTEDGARKRAERIGALPEGVAMVVARSEGKIVAFSRATRREEDNFLNAFYVHPDFFGKGVGTALWQRVREQLDPAKETSLLVAPYNERAKAFYRAVGFETVDKMLEPGDMIELPGGAAIPQQEMRRPADVQSEA